MKPLSILAVLLVFPVSTLATVRNVPGDFATIQAAMNASSSGDEVVVAPGTYAENIVLTAVHSGVWLRSSSGPAATTIDGGLTAPVIRCTNVSAGTTIEGFTITRGRGNGLVLGGGLSFLGSSPTVKNCSVRGNVSGAGGGAYLNQGCNPIIIDSEFADNQAPSGSGGGFYSDNNCSPRIERCNIHHNTCAAYGAGLVTGDFSSSVIINNEIHHNTASLDGGGAWFARQGTLSVVNNRFYQNVGQSGGAMWIQGGGGTFEENQIYENRASTNDGGGIFCTTTVTIRNNVFWSNAAHSQGGAIALSNGLCLVEGNTIVRNTAVVGAGISCDNFSGASNTLRLNIVAYQLLGGGIRGFGATFECNDVFQNAGGNYQIFTDQTGLNGNISSDPVFCNLLTFDLTIAQGSPCVPANSPCDALIGALGPACGPLATKQATWGAVKALYR